jgi:hypothetical protein
MSFLLRYFIIVIIIITLFIVVVRSLTTVLEKQCTRYTY